MSTPLRFGIVSTGNIASSFATDFAKVSGGELVAVASRSQESARRFADQHGIERAHGGYEALAEDPDVDAVYIATPHPRHADDTCLMLEAGKHVLCEKPFAMNSAEGTRMIEAARANDRFVMEAMWSRFCPSWNTARDRIGAGAIGAPRHLSARFCIPAPPDPSHRLLNPALGGGSLIDLGIYTLGLGWFLFGEPESIDARGVVEGGVDLTTSLLAQWADGTTGSLTSSVAATVAIDAHLLGADGSIEWEMPMHAAGAITVNNDEGSQRIETPDNGLHHQTQHFIDCVAAGESESPIVPHGYTLAMLGRLDAVRADIGLVYDADR